MMFDDFNLLFHHNDSLILTHNKKKIKKVNFSIYNSIYLIPMYYEIYNYEQLWWSHEDLVDIKNNAITEIKCFLKINPSMTYYYAKKLLYQNNICYDRSNFEDYE